ncbi:MAG: 1-(5-phosphoribosyl)-5-[(5-phosphoribosylamino)methylideneamino]imidazole-4-carboxamide isomerase [Bacteroidales bacterium]|nr:1-(5-phosphoribosyl)-5-[(5-phosphoribosylamino)methylideneamino]imidazole-4-carboxamide isomerase [Candidatus Equibacterium intestinale]
MIQIIPAIDIIEGRCVRLSQGDYSRSRCYDAQPLDMALRYEETGIRRLHLVDLDGAKAGGPQNLKVLEQIASRTSLEVELGGGIKSTDALRAVFEYGATYAICGSVAVKQPELFNEWLMAFGPEKIILGADLRNGRVSVNGWLEDVDMTIDDLIGLFPSVSQIICTDISKDGMLRGPAFDLYTDLQGRWPAIDFTVSGGISSMSDIERLDDAGLRRVIVGKAIYENRITLKQLREWLQNA